MRFKNQNYRSFNFLALVVVPLSLLLTAAFTADRWLAAGRVPGFTFNECQALHLRSSEPASDVLLIGSSRLGLAIDSEVVQKSLVENQLSVEKRMIIGSIEAQQDHALREYINNRGAPKVLGIEISIDRKPGDENDSWTQYRSTTWIQAVPSWSINFQFVKSLLDKGVISLRDIMFHSRVQNPLATTLARFQLGIEQVLHHPDQLKKPEKGCNRSYFKMFKNGWAEPMPDDYELPSEAKKIQIQESANRVPDANINSSRAVGEFVVLQDMIDFATKSGVEDIFLIYFPDFEEDPEVMPINEIQTRVPGVPIFDVREVFKNADPRVRFQFLDWRHLNSYGGWVVSSDIAQFISNLK